MKKFFYSVLAVATMLLATTSCSQEEEMLGGGTVDNGTTQKVTFKVGMPDESVASRTIADGVTVGGGNKANTLIWALYEKDKKDTNNNPIKLDCGLVTGEKNEETGKHEFTAEISMVKGLTYNVLFFAYDNSNCAFTLAQEAQETDLTALTLKKDNVGNFDLDANQEGYDAFVKCQQHTASGSGVPTEVTLTRPFAQVNVATTEDDLEKAKKLQAVVTKSDMVIKQVPTQYNVLTGAATEKADLTYAASDILKHFVAPGEAEPTHPNEDITVNNESYKYLTMAYVLAGETATSDASTHDVTFKFYRGASGDECMRTINIGHLPIQRNYRTNVIGDILTVDESFKIVIDQKFVDDNKYGVLDGQIYIKVYTAEEFNAAFTNDDYDMIILGDDIALNESLSRAGSDPTLTIPTGKTLTIDLNQKTLSSTSSVSTGNYDMILVKGSLTVKNGTITTEHKGENMLWNSMTTIFDITAGGVVNLEGVTAKNLGGSDMGFVAHLNNWGEVTLNVDNSTLESNYVAVRVFNSGNDMNNVTIKNSTLKGNNYAFWVHNYTIEDFGTEEKTEAHKALLNLNIFNQGNTFSPDINGIRFGFTNSIKSDAYGITKIVNEDGSIVTLGSIVENGVIRRYVAGAEENQTIKKVVIEEGVTTLYDRTFRRFYALETVELPSTLTTIGEAGTGVFQSCSLLKNITLPESLTTLGKGSFYGCRSLESINIPAGVTRIEEDVLRETGLKSVVFHEGVTYFGKQAFRDCEDLTEIVIKAPKFTVESNTFLNAATPYPNFTIYVANAEMKTYLESMLDNHQKTFITVVAPSVVETSDALIEALENGENVVFSEDIKIDPAGMSNAYGTTGINVKNGQTIDGGGNTLDIAGAGGTWDSGINTTGGLIKNLTVTGSFRGIFINHDSDYSEPVILENVVIDGTTYTISCDQGLNQTLKATNCTFNGWTSYAATLGSAEFISCSFGEGAGYAYCRPYATTEFVDCDFEEGFKIDPCATITFKNCRLNGVELNAENLAILVEPYYGDANNASVL